MFGFLRKKQPPAVTPEAALRQSLNIVADFGEFLEQNALAGEIVDESRLPHDKEHILACIKLLLTVSSSNREELKVGAMTLAQCQKGIGKHPLYPIGFDPLKFDVTKMSAENARGLIDVNPAGVEAFNRMQPRVEADMRRIKAVIDAAERAYQLTYQRL